MNFEKELQLSAALFSFRSPSFIFSKYVIYENCDLGIHPTAKIKQVASCSVLLRKRKLISEGAV